MKFDIKAAGKIVIGVKGDYPPWGVINKHNAFEGWEIDLAHKLAEFLFGDPADAHGTLLQLPLERLRRDQAGLAFVALQQVLAEALSGSERYLPVPYEAVMADRTAWAEKLYAFAGLEMTEETRAQVEAMRNTLFGERKSDGLEPDLVAAAVEEVTADSAWWKTFGGSSG